MTSLFILSLLLATPTPACGHGVYVIVRQTYGCECTTPVPFATPDHTLCSSAFCVKTLTEAWSDRPECGGLYLGAEASP